MMFIEEILAIFHGVNRFLGSDGGFLLKVSFELLLFLFMAYMATSQYVKTRNRQVKYLSISFLTLALTKGISTAFYGATVFGSINRVWIDVIIPPIENALEVLVLYVLGVALTYQLLRINVPDLRKKFYAASGLLTWAMIGFVVYWFSTLSDRPYQVFVRTEAFTFIALLKILVLGAFVAYIIYYYEKAAKVEKYANVIIQACVVYAIPSILHIFNYLFHNGASQRLLILANPFPFIAVFLFIRYSYLKLADKASLIDKLDLTERKYRRIKEVTKLKDEFVSIASHELKTPLTTINLYTSLLADGTFGQVTDEQKEALQTLKSETKRLTNLVNELLDLSRIENGKLVLKKERVDFHRLVSEVSFGFQAQHPTMKIKNKVPQKLQATIDDERIRQVLINLIGNATKFTPKEGTIEVSAKKVDQSLIFSVKDNGKGIPKNKLNNLFQKFYQVDPHLARKEGIIGLGLGLAIVKGIIDAHEGKIEVDSELGKGTKFTVTLPQISPGKSGIELVGTGQSSAPVNSI
ncbi:MAG TPA: HAMP domain-containing sensor histidine kinase [Candidatus Nanoarchaeia archaeon]|nr:HAMP domain-containing sensor histidine kinase [Candidatus Nanoarchaeia archaeon]